MKTLAALLLTLTGFSFVAIPPSQAQSKLCFTLSEELGHTLEMQVYAGDRFDFTSDGSGDPGYITGEVMDSRVNVHLGPGAEYGSNAYGLVGDYITALKWGYDQNCEEWYLVRFPDSQYEGWIKGTHIYLLYPRGLFD